MLAYFECACHKFSSPTGSSQVSLALAYSVCFSSPPAWTCVCARVCIRVCLILQIDWARRTHQLEEEIMHTHTHGHNSTNAHTDTYTHVHRHTRTRTHTDIYAHTLWTHTDTHFFCQYSSIHPFKFSFLVSFNFRLYSVIFFTYQHLSMKDLLRNTCLL